MRCYGFKNLQILIQIQILFNLPTSIYEDNQPTIAAYTSKAYTNMTKHVSIKYQHLEDMVVKNRIKIVYIEIKKQLTDSFTKKQTCIYDIYQLYGIHESKEILNSES